MPRPQPPDLARASIPAGPPRVFPLRPLPVAYPEAHDGEPLTLAAILRLADSADATIDRLYPELHHAA